MRLIGLLGGLGWQTTAMYYRLMNECVQKKLGDGHSARTLMHAVDYHAIEPHLRSDDWDGIGRILGEAACGLKAGGAEFLVIASNALHRVADRISSASGLELLHIADPAGFKIHKDGFRKVGLLGTQLTMSSRFYSDRLSERFGIAVITPEPREQAEVHRIIFDELAQGVVRNGSRHFLGTLIRDLHGRGADAIMLGCSVITMIVPPDNDMIPVYDATRLHTQAAVNLALQDAHV